MIDDRKWENRTTDNRSLALHLVCTFALVALHTTLMFIGMWIGLDDISLFYLFIIEIVVGLMGFFVFRYMGQLGFYIRPKIIEHGHVGLIKFRDSFTGEIAYPGPIILPLGYEFQSIDCRQFMLESEISKVRSRDGFIVEANITTWLKVSNSIAYATEGFSKDEMIKLLRSALFSAASRKNALDIIGDRDQICQEAMKEVTELASHYGIQVAKVAIDIQSIPEELTSLIQMLAILEKKYPEERPSELIEILMMNSGKITKSRSEITNVSRLEIPGLDAVLAAAASRYG